MTEVFKSGVHLSAFGVCCVLVAYNLGELLEQRDREHALNSAIYALACGWELHQALKHLRRPQL